MPFRSKVTQALRYLKQNPNVSERGIMHIGEKLRGAEEQPGQSQKYLSAAYQYLHKNQHYRRGSPLLKNIGRVSRAIGHKT
jgi:hypothetical protein